MSPVGQQLFDRFCRDIDDNFREMGVGDLTVPKEMQTVAEAFYGRAKAYESALAGRRAAALEAAVARNVFGVDRAAAGRPPPRCLYARGEPRLHRAEPRCAGAREA